MLLCVFERSNNSDCALSRAAFGPKRVDDLGLGRCFKKIEQ